MPGVAWGLFAGFWFGISQLCSRQINQRRPALAASTLMVTSMLGFMVLATIVTGEFRSLGDVGARPAGWFILASIVHFTIGWTVFAMSQRRIGASRTASILSMNPVMAALLAAIVLGEQLRAITWAGVVAVTLGVGLVATSRLAAGDRPEAGPWLAILCTVMFSISPIFVRYALEDFDRPLLGLTLGLAVIVPVMHVVTRISAGRWAGIPEGVGRWWVLGGFAGAVGITSQWTAFDLITVGAAISLQQINTPVVLFLGPILLVAPLEKPTPRLVAGTACIIGGAVLVALFGRTIG